MKPTFFTKASIFATFILCCVIMALLCSSLATDYWVTSSGVRRNSSDDADINFGLFKGQKTKSTSQLSDRTFDLKVVCLTNASFCMFSCGLTADERANDLADLIYNDGAGWDEGAKCTSTGLSAPRRVRAQAGARPAALSVLLTTGGAPLTGLAAADSEPLLTEVPKTEPEFMSYGLWLSTIVMMGAAIAFVLVAAMFAILNTATNPVETITGVIGLYVWNGIAMVFELLALCLWGAQFHQRLQHSVLWREELEQEWTTDGLASLGYSYWLVFVAMILHAINMAILWYGTHQKQPKKVLHPVEHGNTSAVMY